MSILSDQSIIERCITPKAIFNQELYDQLVFEARHRAMSNTVLGRTIPPDLTSCEHGAWLAPTEKQLAEFAPMIEPFDRELIRETERPVMVGSKIETQKHRIISAGLTSYGYDVSLSDDFKLFTNINSAVIDPKRPDPSCFIDARPLLADDGSEYVLLPPNSYLLASTVEYFRIPRDVMVICVGKSTYARAGAIVNTTPIEPGFEGNVVIEISNATNLPLRIYAREGIAQFMFFKGDRPCRTSYGDRGGKYQGQTGITLGKV